jgi:hypothetical protein
MVSSTPDGYAHTQRAPLCLILYGAAVYCLLAAALIWSEPFWAVFLAVLAAFFAALGSAFQQLTVEDRGDHLAIRFGPLPLFRRTVRYEDIDQVEVGRTTILESWGIHMSPRGGWVWNLWGRDCVIVRGRHGILRIGTDDAANLGHFLEARTRRS